MLFITGAVLVLLTACSAEPATCAGLPANGPRIKVEGAWARTANTATSAAYLSLTNCGSETDTLRGVQSDTGMAQLHLSEMKAGVASMQEVSGIELGAGKTVELKPNSYHIMLMNLPREIKAGDSLKLTLLFEKAGNIEVTAPAKSP
jgi:copper(I)-binding protein